MPGRKNGLKPYAKGAPHCKRDTRLARRYRALDSLRGRVRKSAGRADHLALGYYAVKKCRLWQLEHNGRGRDP